MWNSTIKVMKAIIVKKWCTLVFMLIKNEGTFY
jgi:hypothetical protein